MRGFEIDKSNEEACMNVRCLGLIILILTLSSCGIADHYAAGNYRPGERGRSACLDQAHEHGYRNVEIQSVQSIGATTGPGTWEFTMRGVASTGREVKLSCEYDEQRRQASVGRVD